MAVFLLSASQKSAQKADSILYWFPFFSGLLELFSKGCSIQKAETMNAQ